MTVTVNEPGHYQLASSTMTDRVGRPLFCASVQIVVLKSVNDRNL